MTARSLDDVPYAWTVEEIEARLVSHPPAPWVICGGHPHTPARGCAPWNPAPSKADYLNVVSCHCPKGLPDHALRPLVVHAPAVFLCQERLDPPYKLLN